MKACESYKFSGAIYAPSDEGSTLVATRITAKSLIPRCFDLEGLHKSVNFFRNATEPRLKKISLANFSIRTSLYWAGRKSSGSNKESQMAWKAPKIVEVPVGMEINMYMCATRK
jgi:coenzyme PQQ precursor peptide PqqA